MLLQRFHPTYSWGRRFPSGTPSPLKLIRYVYFKVYFLASCVILGHLAPRSKFFWILDSDPHEAKEDQQSNPGYAVNQKKRGGREKEKGSKPLSTHPHASTKESARKKEKDRTRKTVNISEFGNTI